MNRLFLLALGVHLLGAALWWAPMALAEGAAAKGKADYYDRLHRPVDIQSPTGGDPLPKGGSCCKQGDCKKRDVEYRNGILFAHIVETFGAYGTLNPAYEPYVTEVPGEPYLRHFDHWIVVPPDIEITAPDVLNHPYRPLQAQVCWSPFWGPICLIPGQSGG